MNNYPKIVQKIHHEFNTASDKLLAEAKEILDKNSKYNLDKVNRLKNIGFTSESEVNESFNDLAKRKIASKQADIINDYSNSYPLYKFINQDNVIKICKKYDLVYGDIGLYKGFVPEKNLLDIEKFSSINLFSKHIVSKWNIKITEITFYQSDEKNKNVKRFLSDLENMNYIIDKYLWDKHGSSYGYGENTLTSIANNEWGMNIPTVRNCNIKHEETPNLLICAPVKDMNMEGRTVKNNKVLELFKPKVRFEDPIVLKPVKDGYLIVTAWGDEASDELVVNQKMN